MGGNTDIKAHQVRIEENLHLDKAALPSRQDGAALSVTAMQAVIQ